MGTVRLVMWSRSVVLLAVLLVAALTVRVEAERGDIVPIGGPVGVLHTSLTSFSSVVVDDANQRVYIVSKQGNTILAADFLGNQTAIRTTFAQPSNLVVGGGYAYALLAGTGQVVRLDPATLAPTVLAGGLINPAGLAYAGGFLYVFSELDEFNGVLRKINATTGAMTSTSIVTSFYTSFQLFAFPEYPGYLYGTGNPSYRWNLSTGEASTVNNLAGVLAMLPDGQLASGWTDSTQTSGVLSHDAVTSELTGRVWRMRPPENYFPITWAASRHALALNRGNLVELASVDRPAQAYRSYRFTDFDSFYGMQLAMAADSSRLFAIMPYAGTIHLYAVPGVGTASTPSAPNGGSGSARTGAPAAPGANQNRVAAPRAESAPPWAMRSVTDIEFASDGSVYASDSVNGVINRFALDGFPITGWRHQSGVEALAEHNGSMYGVLRYEGTIVRFSPDLASPVRVATGIQDASGLTSANGKLWTTYHRSWYWSKLASFDPVTRAVWFQPDDFGSGYDWEQVFLAESPIAGHLLGYRSYDALRFDLSTLSFVADPPTLSPPFAVSPDGLSVIDGSGTRLTSSPFEPDGFIFPGTGHTISGANASGRRLVAARPNGYGGPAFVVYDEANPGDIVYSEPMISGYEVGRIEFRPGTTDLWVTLISTATGQAFLFPINVGPVPYVAAMVGDETVLDMGAVLPTRRLSAALASIEGSASSYAQPGDQTTGPTPPSTLVRPSSSGTVAVPTTLVDLTPAAVLQPDPVSPQSMPAATAASSTVSTSSASNSVSVPGSSTAASVATTTTSSGASAPVAVVAAVPPGTQPSAPTTRVVPAKRRSTPTTTRRRVPAKRPATAPTPKRR